MKQIFHSDNVAKPREAGYSDKLSASSNIIMAMKLTLQSLVVIICPRYLNNL
jgi:hypothetical protein